MLHLGPHYFPGFMVDGVSVPVGVQSQQLRSYAIVLPEPRRVHGRQPKLLIGAVVSGQKTRNGALVFVPHALGGGSRGKREEWLSGSLDDALAQQPPLAGQVPDFLRFVPGAAVDVGGIDVRGQLVDLLSWVNAVHEKRSHAAAAHGTRAHEEHAAGTGAQPPWVAGGKLNGEARGVIGAHLRAQLAVREAGLAEGRHRSVQVMVKELAPLHQHVGVAIIGSDGLRPNHCCGHQPWQRQPVSVMWPLGSAPWQVKAVVVDRFQEPVESGEGCAPHRVLQVIAGPIVAAILLVEANVGAVIEAAVSCATR